MCLTFQLASVSAVSKLDLEIERCQEKLASIDERMDELEVERRLLALYTREQYIQEQAKTMNPEFRRKQSALFQKLHPDMDLEMNLEEVESALKQINNNLLTEKECQFIYHVSRLVPKTTHSNQIMLPSN
jgi:predicted  nucleic acid-binding Zn-ribbon protein